MPWSGGIGKSWSKQGVCCDLGSLSVSRVVQRSGVGPHDGLSIKIKNLQPTELGYLWLNAHKLNTYV